MPKTILALLGAAAIGASFAAAAHDGGARHIDRMDRMDRMERLHERAPAGPPLASRADENANGRFAEHRKHGLERAAERHEMHEQRHPGGDEPAGRQSSK